jgi:hypothetical protein
METFEIFGLSAVPCTYVTMIALETYCCCAVDLSDAIEGLKECQAHGVVVECVP